MLSGQRDQGKLRNAKVECSGAGRQREERHGGWRRVPTVDDSDAGPADSNRRRSAHTTGVHGHVLVRDDKAVSPNLGRLKPDCDAMAALMRLR